MMTVENNKLALHAVLSVRATAEADVYVVEAEITDLNGETYICDYVSRPGDTFGLAPTIRQWLVDNEGSFEVVPYAPPTAEEIRASLPPLTARQLRLGLIDGGITPSQVQAAIEALPDGPDREKALVEWEYASEFHRLHPLIATVAASLSLTDEQVDALWAAAVNL